MKKQRNNTEMKEQTRNTEVQINEKEMTTHSVLLPGKSHGWKSLVVYSPWGSKESDMTE